MSKRGKTDYSLEQTIFLGGQISQKKQELKDLALMGSKYVVPYALLSNLEKILAETDLKKRALKILYLLGECDFLQSCTELTKLSMILGDTTKHFSLKGLEELLKGDVIE